MDEFYTGGTQLVRLKTLAELPIPDWRQAAEEEHAMRLGAEERMEQLRALLVKRVALDEIAILTEDGPMCHCCGALWDYDDDSPDVKAGSEWHKYDCWVLRVRATLKATP